MHQNKAMQVLHVADTVNKYNSLGAKVVVYGVPWYQRSYYLLSKLCKHLLKLILYNKKMRTAEEQNSIKLIERIDFLIEDMLRERYWEESCSGNANDEMTAYTHTESGR